MQQPSADMWEGKMQEKGSIPRRGPRPPTNRTDYQYTYSASSRARSASSKAARSSATRARSNFFTSSAVE